MTNARIRICEIRSEKKWTTDRCSFFSVDEYDFAHLFAWNKIRSRIRLALKLPPQLATLILQSWSLRVVLVSVFFLPTWVSTRVWFSCDPRRRRSQKPEARSQNRVATFHLPYILDNRNMAPFRTINNLDLGSTAQWNLKGEICTPTSLSNPFTDFSTKRSRIWQHWL